MNTKKIWANLAVNDVEKTWEFYLKLGFKPNCPPSTKELASFLVGDDDFVIHFFEKDRFESSAEGEIADLSKGNEVMFTLSAESKGEVDKWVEEVKKAGGTIFSIHERTKKSYMMKTGIMYVCLPTRMDINLMCSTIQIRSKNPAIAEKASHNSESLLPNHAIAHIQTS